MCSIWAKALYTDVISFNIEAVLFWMRKAGFGTLAKVLPSIGGEVEIQTQSLPVGELSTQCTACLRGQVQSDWEPFEFGLPPVSSELTPMIQYLCFGDNPLAADGNGPL